MLGPIKRRLGNVAGALTAGVNGRFADAILVQANGCQLLVDPRDMKVGRHLRFGGGYGEHELELIRALTSADSTVAFVGAHVGALAIPVSGWVRRAVLVEANPATAHLLALNCQLNRLDNVTLFECAVGEREGEIAFVASRTNSGGSKREPAVKAKMYYYDRPETLRVPLRRFDDLLGTTVDEFDLIYMDIEGSEAFALQGMQETLARTRALVVEFIAHHLRNVAQVSVDDFTALIEPHFDWVFVPSTAQHVPRADFARVLNGMHERGQDEDGIVFSKGRLALP